jgi:hypothetical protein
LTVADPFAIASVHQERVLPAAAQPQSLNRGSAYARLRREGLRG